MLPSPPSELLHLNEAEDCLQRLTERTFCGVSDCEELSGDYSQEMMGLVLVR